MRTSVVREPENGRAYRQRLGNKRREYVYADYREIVPYKETYTLICRSADGDFDFYEIAEYPGREYIVERVFYEAEILKRK